MLSMVIYSINFGHWDDDCNTCTLIENRDTIHSFLQTHVMYSVSPTSRNDSVFKNPKTFLPERWARDFEDKHHRFAVLPFGFGPRDCWGEPPLKELV